MREPIQNYFKIGTLQWMSYPDLSPADGIRMTEADPFFEYVEVGNFKHNLEKQEAGDLLRKSRLEAGYGLAPLFLTNGYNPNALDEMVRKNAENAILEAVDEAAEWGMDSVVMIAGPWQKKYTEQAVNQLVRTTAHACAYAAPKGIRIELEIFDYDFDKCLLVGPASLAADYAERIRRDYNNFGLLADLSHFPLVREKTEDVIRLLQPYMTHFHIGNAIIEKGKAGYGDTHPPFGVQGGANGVQEITEFLKALKKNGFFDLSWRPVLSFEIKPRQGESPDQVLKDAKETLMKAWESV